MHRVSKIAIDRQGRRASIVTITLRSPELAKALHGSGDIAAIAAWGAVSAALCWFAWQGGLGVTAHASVRLTIILALAYWIAINTNRLWRERDRTTPYKLIVQLNDKHITTDGPEKRTTIARDTQEIRFNSQPHRRGKYEERDERRVEHRTGYEYRDAWEVWCEAGRDVHFIVGVSNERDAGARHECVACLRSSQLFMFTSLDAIGDDVLTHNFSDSSGASKTLVL